MLDVSQRQFSGGLFMQFKRRLLVFDGLNTLLTGDQPLLTVAPSLGCRLNRRAAAMKRQRSV
jgi:hypothetical protein